MPVSTPRRLIVPLFAATLALSPFALGSAHADNLLTKLFGSIDITRHEFDTATGRMSLKVNGKIEFNDSDDDVRAIDGSASLEERRNGHTLRVEFSNGANGQVQRRYSVDGQSHAIDAEAKQWLAVAIPTMIRESAIHADQRARRLFDQGGADAVLAEIERLHSDFARRCYSNALNNIGPLDDKRLQRLLASAALTHSDFELRTILVPLAERQSLGVANQIAYLGGAAKMGSDFERRLAMVALVRTLAADDGVARAWQGAQGKMQSDFEARIAIEALSHSAMGPKMIDVALQSTLNLHSDFEHRTALLAVGERMGNASAAQVGLYTRSARAISSAFERRVALVALIERVKLDKTASDSVLDALGGMNSDFETRIALVALARQMPGDAELIAHYRKVARTLGDFERGQAEKALDHFG